MLTVQASSRWLEREPQTGKVGKTADLVLLADDPLRDIHNPQRIAAVISAGRYFDPATLDRTVREKCPNGRGRPSSANRPDV